MAGIGKGRQIGEIPSGHFLSREKMNMLTAFFDAFMNSEVKDGDTTQILIGDRKILITIGQQQNSNSGGNSSYRGEYDPSGGTEFGSGAFQFGDIVRVTPTNVNSTTLGGTIIPGVYVCVLANPETSDMPNHPLSPGGETEFWQWLATYPSKTQECNSDGSSSTMFTDEQDGN